MKSFELSRTFTPVSDLQDDGEDWSEYAFSGKENATWKDLQDKPLVVIVGEAGIGKTIEFGLEVERLRNGGKPAFFVALSQLTDSESWQRELSVSDDGYQRWKSSNETAYFLIDAVDEARLTGQAAFEKALSVVGSELRGCMARVCILLSSRPTDWSIDGVKRAVDKYLAKPIAAERSTLKETPQSEIGTGGTVVNIERPSVADIIEPLVVRLDKLSNAEARRLADAFDVCDSNAFWSAVSDGNYAYMATRPLDLGWMVRLWNERRSLGTCRELVECNIENRLTEVNESYHAAGALLSVDQLRKGAEDLAAAAEFSGRAYVATGYAPALRADEILPSSVIPGWKPDEIARLLASAVFDEATFGRVRFHHRTIRAYLAASWVNRQLAVGVPFHRVLRLFASSPFGTTVLVPSRRWVLCWLAAINVKAREWLTQHFPEMLVFDGDPEAWDSVSADRAFIAYIQRIKDGMRPDWYNDASEFRRVGRRLSPGLVAGLLATPDLPPRATTALMQIAKQGRLADCSGIVFGIYQNSEASQRDRQNALETLETIATVEQRTAIKDDLVSGRLTTNGLVALALPAINWQELRVEQLVSIFVATDSEEVYGPMARAFKEDLLPVATATAALNLLQAVLAALPKPEAGKRFARFSDSDQPERAWLLDVLPDCFERLILLLPSTNSGYPDACIEAAERLEALRNTGYIQREEFQRIHALLTKHPGLRWQVALEIAQSENIIHSTSRLTWGMECIVSFAVADIPELIARANDATVSLDVGNVWFTVGMNMVFREYKGRPRAKALAALLAGPDSEMRRARVATEYGRWRNGAKQQRTFRLEDRARKRGQLAQHEANRVQLIGDVEHIRDASHKGSLHWLTHFSYNRADRKSFTHVDYAVIAKEFGHDVADALAAGLKVAWATAGTPNPADYKNGAVPWEALTALAGLHTLLDNGTQIESLSDSDATRAAKLAVWELNGPPSWFESLALTHGPAVSEALRPWIESEAKLSTEANHLRSLDMALRCSTEVRAGLLKPLVPLIADGSIHCPETLKNIVKALRADRLIAANTLTELCKAQVVGATSAAGLIGELHWLRMWLEEDATSAWNWFEGHVDNHAAVAGQLVKSFAKIAGDCKWVKLPADSACIHVLLQLHRLLTVHLPPADAPVDADDAGAFGHVVSELRSRIPNVLVHSRGISAHRALADLVAVEFDPSSQQWLASQVTEHATLEAAQLSQVSPQDLRDIRAPFAESPTNEAQLLEQAIARLEEVRKAIEEGPFSERNLFSPRMPETHLQNWLAARFRETQNRRFTVSREEEVDDNKKPDIQLGCSDGKVCVEIKPVYKNCGYSANSLTDTLKTQIAKQYLKGYNSNHGILVLFRLDNKTWNIPGGAKRRPFAELIEYLQVQADIIAADEGLGALKVFGIDCVT